jgi:hypothetical protein
MKIKANYLMEFIKKASLNGSIMSINMNFEENGLTSCVQDVMKVALTSTELKKEAFEEYNPIGEIFIKNSKSLINYLRTFEDIVNLEKVEEYILRIGDNAREAFVILGSHLVCENIYRKELPKLAVTTVMELTKEDLDKVTKDMKELQFNMVDIETKDGELIFSVGRKGESDYLSNKIYIGDSKDVKVSIGANILELVNVIEPKFKLSIGQDLPILVEEKTEQIKFTCIIAPIVEGG